MKLIFADTFYWISFVNPRDTWHQNIREVYRSLQPCQLLTTDEVLIELLTFYSKSGFYLKQRAAEFVRGVLDSPDTQVIQQTRQSFLAGLDLYERRLDKGYSLTDCISMNMMRQFGITEVLSHDKHFAQEGFVLLFGHEKA